MLDQETLRTGAGREALKAEYTDEVRLVLTEVSERHAKDAATALRSYRLFREWALADEAVVKAECAGLSPSEGRSDTRPAPR